MEIEHSSMSSPKMEKRERQEMELKTNWFQHGSCCINLTSFSRRTDKPLLPRRKSESLNSYYAVKILFFLILPEFNCVLTSLISFGSYFCKIVVLDL